MKQDVYSLSFTAVDGTEMPLLDFRGQVLLIVNTASKCGFTRQYAGLQKIHTKYHESGFTVIATPCNDFGKQEPLCGLDVKAAMQAEYDIAFPITDKIAIKGEEGHPFYKQATEQFGTFAKPRWNFYKYLVGRDGYIKNWFSPLNGPESGALIYDLEKELSVDTPV